MSSRGSRAGAFRRTKLAAGACVLVLGVLAVVFDAPGRAAPTQTPTSGDFPDGKGSAQAFTLGADPRAGNLSFGVGFGIALAAHQEGVAQGEARSIDLGVPGATAAAQQCDGDPPTLPEEDQPQPVRVDSRDENAAAGRTTTEDFTGGTGLDFEKHASANPAPFAESYVRTGPLTLAGAVVSSGARAASSSGVFEGYREATAVTDIAELNLAGGQVILRNLRWEARWRSGSEEIKDGNFTVGYAAIGGGLLPLPTQDTAELFQALNEVLINVGIVLHEPKATERSGFMFVDPLKISVVPNENRDRITGAVVTGLQPVREPLFQAILDISCDYGTEITVYDVAIASITGAGSFDVLFGGVQASSGELVASRFTLGTLTLPTAPNLGAVTPPAISTAPGSAAPAARPNLSTATGTATPAAASTGAVQGSGVFQPVSSTDGGRGGELAAAGLLSLLFLAAVAEADRRKMRRAQRMIPMEG